MADKRHKPEEIVQKLRQVDVLVGQVMQRVDAIRGLTLISFATRHRKSGRQFPYTNYRRQVSRSDMDEELAQANQRINDMSFKDLTARAAAAMKPKPEKTAKTPDQENEPKPAGKEDIPAKSKTSSGSRFPRMKGNFVRM